MEDDLIPITKTIFWIKEEPKVISHISHEDIFND